MARHETEYDRMVNAMRRFNQICRDAWIEYDSTVDWQQDPPRRHLERICAKHRVDPYDVLAWYKEQPNDEIR